MLLGRPAAPPRPPPPPPTAGPPPPQIMFVLVVLSLTLCLVALIYLLAHKHESFKEALSFTIVLLVSTTRVHRARLAACSARCWPLRMRNAQL